MPDELTPFTAPTFARTAASSSFRCAARREIATWCGDDSGVCGYRGGEGGRGGGRWGRRREGGAALPSSLRCATGRGTSTWWWCKIRGHKLALRSRYNLVTLEQRWPRVGVIWAFLSDFQWRSTFATLSFHWRYTSLTLTFHGSYTGAPIGVTLT